ncbi:hypothetical protein [Polyangium sp. y55x31]|uniref:hypothetical protein n=1 Tax=Polyangium sp. y55x31 TaxID=3042688 RepID=UPI002482203E|nr:hypothetical protein [Polyangium sp. y55x31]MDI1475466.1 hypothetical protein [Polyangium sp. y55x31]
MKNLLPILALGLGLVTGYAAEASARDPIIIQHPPPRVPAVNVAPFLDAGCARSDDTLDCSASTTIKRFGCFGDTLHIDESLGGLAPRVAIAECNADARDGSAVGIVDLGCMLPQKRRYLLATGGGNFELIDTVAGFIDRFAPVTSQAEALGFAVALTTANPEYSIDINDGRDFLVDRIATTNIRRVRGGYRVRLFDMEVCGCGLHPTSAVDYFVPNSGRVRVADREQVYRFTAVVCID